MPKIRTPKKKWEMSCCDDEMIPRCAENGCPYDQSKCDPADVPEFEKPRVCDMLGYIVPAFIAIYLLASPKKRKRVYSALWQV